MEYRRFEDNGMARLIKLWPFIIAIFTAGAWYQSARANNVLTDKHEHQLNDHEKRITQVEDAVLYLKQLVEDGKHRHD